MSRKISESVEKSGNGSVILPDPKVEEPVAEIEDEEGSGEEDTAVLIDEERLARVDEAGANEVVVADVGIFGAERGSARRRLVTTAARRSIRVHIAKDRIPTMRPLQHRTLHCSLIRPTLRHRFKLCRTPHVAVYHGVFQ